MTVSYHVRDHKGDMIGLWEQDLTPKGNLPTASIEMLLRYLQQGRDVMVSTNKPINKAPKCAPCSHESYDIFREQMILKCSRTKKR